MINIEQATDQMLLDYDWWITSFDDDPCILASQFWIDVLKELDKRKLVELVDGSYDDPENARIRRLVPRNYQADQDIAAGNVKRFSSADEMLDNLKKE